MMAENVGRLLYDAQDELKQLKSEIDMCQNPSNNNSPRQYHYMLNKIKQQLSKFEEKIEDKVYYLMSSEMTSHGGNSNRLASVSKYEAYDSVDVSAIARTEYRHAVRTKGASSSLDKEVKTNPKLDPRFLFIQKLLNNPNSEITKKIIQSKYALPPVSTVPAKSKPPSPLKPARKEPVVGPITKPIGILPKEIRENPFAMAPIREKDVKAGVLNLMYRGLIPKSVDLTPAFERNSKTLSTQKVRFHDKKEKSPDRSRDKINKTFDRGYKTKERKPLKPISIQVDTESNRGMGDMTFKASEYSPSSDSQLFEKMVAKGYDQVMDAYSLHQFVIRKGKALTDTPEFQSYQRTYSGIWDSINQLIQALEQILIDYNVETAQVDGKKLAKIAEGSLDNLKLPELLECVINQDDIKKVVKIPQNMFKDPKRKVRTAHMKHEKIIRELKGPSRNKSLNITLDTTTGSTV